MCRINPKVDFAFKKLFGSEENKDILMAFINSVLTEDEQVTEIKLKNPYNLTDYMDGKMSILDIKAIDQTGIWYDIEIQLPSQGYYDKKALYYWAKVYSDQLQSGYDYDLLKKTISINILDFNYLDEKDFHNIYEIINKKSKNRLTNVLQMHFIELNKFKKDYHELKTALDRWIIFLNRAYEMDKNNIPKELSEDKNIKKAIEKLDLMYLDKEEREMYENDLKLLRTHKAEIKTAEEKGREEEKIKIAKSLLDVLDVETIAKKTGLSIEEVEKLK